MGHYYSEMYEETPEDRVRVKAMAQAKALCKLPASRFTVDEIVFISRIGWSSCREAFYQTEWPQLEALAKREGVV